MVFVDGVVFCILQVDGQMLLEAFLVVLEGFSGVHSSVQLRMQLLTASLSFLKFAFEHAASALQCTSPDSSSKVSPEANITQQLLTAAHMYDLYLATRPQAKPSLHAIQTLYTASMVQQKQAGMSIRTWAPSAESLTYIACLLCSNQGQAAI